MSQVNLKKRIVAIVGDNEIRHKKHGIVSVRLNVPLRPIVELLSLPMDGERMLWAPGNGNPSSNHGWTIAGLGETARIDASGDSRFAEIKNRSQSLFNGITVLEEQDLSVPFGMRLFGGAAFFPDGNNTLVWRSFGDASFSLPKWSYGTDGNIGVLQMTLPEDDLLESDSWHEEADLLDDWLSAVMTLEPSPPGQSHLVEEMSEESWHRLVVQALEAIEAGAIEKVVVSRSVRADSEECFSLSSVVGQLNSSYPDCLRFAVQRGDSTFVGATPERLVMVSESGCSIEADALAGSIMRAENGEDQEAVLALLESEKDRREFEYVLKDLSARMMSIGTSLTHHTPPKVRSLRNLHHLHSTVYATAQEPVHVLDVLDALHPTPAVCGTPTYVALQWLREHEGYTRGWYAGPVGWFDERGEGDFGVGIRSALLSGKQARIFAGSGIVKGSEPHLEHEETSVKLTAMKTALGAR